MIQIKARLSSVVAFGVHPVPLEVRVGLAPVSRVALSTMRRVLTTPPTRQRLWRRSPLSLTRRPLTNLSHWHHGHTQRLADRLSPACGVRLASMDVVPMGAVDEA